MATFAGVTFFACNDDEKDSKKRTWLCIPDTQVNIMLKFEDDIATTTIINKDSLDSQKIYLFNNRDKFKLINDSLYLIDNDVIDTKNQGFKITYQNKDSVYMEPFGIGYYQDANLVYVTEYKFKKL